MNSGLGKHSNLGTGKLLNSLMKTITFYPIANSITGPARATVTRIKDQFTGDVTLIGVHIKKRTSHSWYKYLCEK